MSAGMACAYCGSPMGRRRPVATEAVCWRCWVQLYGRLARHGKERALVERAGPEEVSVMSERVEIVEVAAEEVSAEEVSEYPTHLYAWMWRSRGHAGLVGSYLTVEEARRHRPASPYAEIRLLRIALPPQEAR